MDALKVQDLERRIALLEGAEQARATDEWQGTADAKVARILLGCLSKALVQARVIEGEELIRQWRAEAQKLGPKDRYLQAGLSAALDELALHLRDAGDTPLPLQ